MKEKNITNYNYDSIKYFLSVARHGSLSKAAYSLGISQSALSQSMKNLEESLGITLFTRNTRGIILTDEGETLYKNASIGNNYFEKAIIQSLRTNKFGENKDFIIDVSDSLFHIFLIPIMNNIISKYPNINFKINYRTSEINVVKTLQNNKADLIILKTGKNFVVKEVDCTKIKDLNYYLVYDPKYFKFDKSVNLDSLKNIPIIRKHRTGKNDNSWNKRLYRGAYYVPWCEKGKTEIPGWKRQDKGRYKLYC
jgi:DNA-binding transcriptional LysR family regulator